MHLLFFYKSLLFVADLKAHNLLNPFIIFQFQLEAR